MNLKFSPVKKVTIIHYFPGINLKTSKSLAHPLNIKNKMMPDAFTRQEAKHYHFFKVCHFF